MAGMTRAAIESWRERAAAAFAVDRVNKIAALLIEASTRAELLVDDSREVFEESVRPNVSSIDDIKQQLLKAL